LLFQLVDVRPECISLCIKEQIKENVDINQLTQTWSYSNILKNTTHILFADCFSQNNLHGACPSSMQDELRGLKQRFVGFLNSARYSGIQTNKVCYTDLIPERFIIKFCSLKDRICSHVFENYEKPIQYESLVKIARMLVEIASKPLKIDFSSMRPFLHESRTRQMEKTLQKANKFVQYEQFKTKTGRLGVVSGGFPILNLDKKFRSIIKPHNDFFVELDFNAAEIRSLFGLVEQKQPEEDVYRWLMKEVGFETREEAKLNTIKWMYDSSDIEKRVAYSFDSIFNKKLLLEKFGGDKEIKTIYGRVIPADDHHAINYILQSTTADMCLRQMVKVNEYLQDKKTRIAFCMHDAIILDMKSEEREHILSLRDVFSQTELGKYKTSLKIGRDYGTMGKVL